MKQLFVYVFFSLVSIGVYSGEWIQVKGGVVEFDLQQVKLENELWVYLTDSPDYKFQSRNSYTYQYQMINANILKIQALCNFNSHHDLSANFLIVMDGGSCYFEAHYNIVSGKFTNLNVNGVA